MKKETGFNKNLKKKHKKNNTVDMDNDAKIK